MAFTALRPSVHLSLRSCPRFAKCSQTAVRINRLASRSYAQVGTATFVGDPPPPPPSQSPDVLDATILASLPRAITSLPTLIEQSSEQSGHVLDVSLPYESRPDASRRTPFNAPDRDAVAMIAHAVQRGGEHKVTRCSGFALDVDVPGLNHDGKDKTQVLVTCMHTLQEIRQSPLITDEAPNAKLSSGSFVLSGGSALPTPSPITSVLSSLTRSDVLLLTTQTLPSTRRLRTLPISPYPVHPGTPIRAHFVADTQPPNAAADGWEPWVGGTWSRWVRGTVVGYRDSAGREAKPGTYDALAHMLFDPPPTPGSSGGPIVDEESGAVVGMMLGTLMLSRLEGLRGWGIPSEALFEMFRLPGLKLNN